MTRGLRRLFIVSDPIMAERAVGSERADLGAWRNRNTRSDGPLHLDWVNVARRSNTPAPPTRASSPVGRPVAGASQRFVLASIFRNDVVGLTAMRTPSRGPRGRPEISVVVATIWGSRLSDDVDGQADSVEELGALLVVEP